MHNNRAVLLFLRVYTMTNITKFFMIVWVLEFNKYHARQEYMILCRACPCQFH